VEDSNQQIGWLRADNAVAEPGSGSVCRCQIAGQALGRKRQPLMDADFAA